MANSGPGGLGGTPIVMVGDGTYMMMNSDIYSTVLSGHKMIVIVCDNGGFAVINRLQQAKGVPGFNNLLGRLPRARTAARRCTSISPSMRKSMGAAARRCESLADLEAALEWAKANDRTTVLSIASDAYAWVPGDAEWDVGVPEVSSREVGPRARASNRNRFAPSSRDRSVRAMKAKLGIAPIAWWNDDLAELSDDVSLEECLRQASVAGFTGMETGRRFPMNMNELGPILARYGISVCGGWFSGLLLDGDIEREKDRIRAQMDFFIAAKAPCIVYGETARSIQGERSAPLATKPKLSEDEIKAYGRKMTAFAEWCAEQGMPISYHHHMAAAIETEPELDLLMANSGEALPLLVRRRPYGFRRRRRAARHRQAPQAHQPRPHQGRPPRRHRQARPQRESFLDAVVKGAFTVPGDGSLDFAAIVGRLASYGYEGWFVVEAEQDPKVSPPLEMAKKGHAELMRVMALAGYEVIQ